MASKLTPPAAGAVSFRKTRESVAYTQVAVNRQAEAIVELARRLGEQKELLDDLLERGFFGRLRWLLTGR
jgi:hypothetical protein